MQTLTFWVSKNKVLPEDVHTRFLSDIR
jgi:hypothetical protein